MLRFPVRPDALLLNLIWDFETTSKDIRQPGLAAKRLRLVAFNCNRIWQQMCQNNN
jgi:hypothetical protein